MVLTRLKKAAELHFNMPVRDVVITVPAYFSDAQRQVRRQRPRMTPYVLVLDQCPLETPCMFDFAAMTACIGCGSLSTAHAASPRHRLQCRPRRTRLRSRSSVSANSSRSRWQQYWRSSVRGAHSHPYADRADGTNCKDSGTDPV